MVLADTLSRAYIKGKAESNELEDDLICAVKLVINNLPVSDPKLQEIRSATEQDPTLTKLKNTIQLGWPEKRSQVPQELRDYWNYRDELSEADGIILKGSFYLA